MFVDLGCKDGRGMPRLKERFGCDGVGVELNRKHVKTARNKGFDVVLGDASLPLFKSNSVAHVGMEHFLEHLPNIKTVKATVQHALDMATESVYIRGPWFDADKYLADRGFNLFWSSWKGHTCHLKTRTLCNMLDSLGLDFTIEGTGDLITDSLNPRVHNVGYEAGHNYTRGEYPPKSYMEFDIPIYQEMVCEIRLTLA